MRRKLGIVLLSLTLTSSLVGCSSGYKEESIVDYAETQGVACVNDTEGYSHIDGVVNVRSVFKDDIYVEFWDFDSTDSASKWRSDYENSLMHNNDFEKIDGGYLISDFYYKLVQSGKTCYYVRSTSQETANSTLTTLGVK